MQGYRPDRVVRVLTTLVSIAYYGLLVITGLLLIGMPALKVLAADNPDWTIGLPVPVAELDSTNATVLTRWGEAQITVEDVRGSLKLPISMLPWWFFAVLWTDIAAGFALMLLFLHHLRRIFQSVRGGAPFDAANAVRLRWLGLLLLGLAVLNGVSETVAALAARRGLVSDRMAVPVGLHIDGSLVLFALVLLALAAIFRRGAELEAEQSLTI